MQLDRELQNVSSVAYRRTYPPGWRLRGLLPGNLQLHHHLLPTS